MHNAFQGVAAAQLEWREINQDGKTYFAPYSPQFDDIYFNTHNGIAESQYVFLEGNQLTKRFQQADNDFVIFETGFGSGLNFLLTAKLWQQAKNKQHLHFYSIEQFPITSNDLERIYHQLNIRNSISEQLLDQYPPILPGIYPIQIAPDITLHLIFFPLTQALKEIAINDEFKVDAWFLDGFAPSKNPEMWHKGLWHFMALHAVNNESRQTSLATFTAASEIRKMLQHYGFKVQKHKGFGHKREMLVAQFDQKQLSTTKPTLASDYLSASNKPQRIAIIGAGLAGCTTAYCLKQAGFEIEIFEQGNKVVSGASKMPALLAMPNLSIDHNAFSQLTFSGFYRLYQFAKQHPELIAAWQTSQLSSEKYSSYQLDKYFKQYKDRVIKNFDWQSEDNNQFQQEALLLPAIQVDGKTYCEFLIKQLEPNKIHLNTQIKSLAELKSFDQVIVCTGHGTILNNLGIKTLPTVMPLRGQLTGIKAETNLQYPINYDGHLFQKEQQWLLGATFENSLDSSVKKEDDQSNLAQANHRLGLDLQLNKNVKSYVGIRASSYDRFPFCGLYRQNQKQTVWLNYGYGTRGLCLSLLMADIIKTSMNNETLPVSKNILQRLSPKRIQS